MKNFIAFYNDIAEQVRALVPAKLITITFCDFDDGEVFRVFSTMPEEFTVSGRKTISQTQSEWNDTVFKEQKCFTIDRVRDYPEHFYDYEHIESLGLSSALCVPIIHKGDTIGTMNILDAQGSYQDAPLEDIIKVVGQLSSVYEENLALSKTA